MTAIRDVDRRSGAGPRTRGAAAPPDESGQVGWGVLAWVVGIAFFLPVLWMVLTAFKPESAAADLAAQVRLRPARWRSSGWCFSGWGPYVTHSLIATTVLHGRWCWCWASRPRTRCRCTRSRTGAT